MIMFFFFVLFSFHIARIPSWFWYLKKGWHPIQISFSICKRSDTGPSIIQYLHFQLVPRSMCLFLRSGWEKILWTLLILLARCRPNYWQWYQGHRPPGVLIRFWVIRNHGTVKTVALWKSHLDSLLFQPKAHLINTWGQNLSFVPNLLTFWSTCHLLRDLSFLWTNFLMWLCRIGRTSKCLIYYQIFWNLIPSKKPAVQTNIGKPRIFNKYFSTRFVWWKSTMLHQRSQDALTLIRTTNPNLLKDMKLIKLGLSGWKLLVFKTQSVEHFFLHFWFVCADGNVRF